MNPKNLLRFILGLFFMILLIIMILLLLLLLSPIIVLGVTLYSILVFLLVACIIVLLPLSFVYYMFREEPITKKTKHSNSYSISQGKEVK